MMHIDVTDFPEELEVTLSIAHDGKRSIRSHADLSEGVLSAFVNGSPNVHIRFSAPNSPPIYQTPIIYKLVGDRTDVRIHNEHIPSSQFISSSRELRYKREQQSDYVSSKKK